MNISHQRMATLRAINRKQKFFLSEFNKAVEACVSNPPSTEFLEALSQHLKKWQETINLELLSRRTTSGDF